MSQNFWITSVWNLKKQQQQKTRLIRFGRRKIKQGGLEKEIMVWTHSTSYSVGHFKWLPNFQIWS